MYGSKPSAVLHSFKERLIANILLLVQGINWRIEDRIVALKDDDDPYAERRNNSDLG